MGKKEGSQVDGLVVSAGALVPVGLGVPWVLEGLELVGRSGWSVGFSAIADFVGPGLTAVLVAEMVVVSILSWSSSSWSVGIGSNFAFEASIDSPNSFRCQSINVPL